MPYNNTPIAPSKEVTGHVSLPLARVQKIINADPERINVSKNAAFAIALATEMFIQHMATTTHNVVKAERKPRRNIQYRDVSSAIAKTDNLEFAVDVVPKTTTFKEFKKKQEESQRVSESVATTGSGAAGSSGKGKEKVKDGVNGEGSSTLEARLMARAGESDKPLSNGTTNGNTGQAGPSGTQSTEKNGVSEDGPAKAEPAPEAMEVDQQPERVEDSEQEEDAAAMQLEMEMRGPPRPNPIPEARRSTGGGFTAINEAR